MAQETIQYNIELNTGNTLKTLGDVEKELAKINDELKEVEVGSDRFDELSSKAQVLNKDFEKINSSIQGITGEDKIRALDGSVKVLGGSVQGLVGGLGLLGIESEQFGKFEEKAASAIALGIGIKDVGEGIGQLSQVTGKLPSVMKKATAAQKAFNLVVRANPIGAVVTAISLAVAGFLLFSEKGKELIKSIEPLNKILQKTVNFFKMIGRSLGLVATEEEEAAEKFKKSTDSRIADIDREVALRKAKGEETVELEREKLQKLIALTEEGSEEQKNALNDLAVFEETLLKQKQDKIDEANKIAADKRKAERERIKKEAEDADKNRIKSLDNIAAQFRKKAEDAEADTEVKKLELEKERTLAELDRLKATEEQKKQIKEYYATLIKEAEDEAKELADEEKDEADEEEYEKLKEQEEKKLQLKLDSLQTLSELFGQETALGKAALIAKQAILLQELLGEAKGLTFKAKTAAKEAALDGVKSTSALAAGTAETAKVGFPQNIPLLIGYAAQAAGIFSAVKSAVSKTQQIAGASGGGSLSGLISTAAPAIVSTPTSANPTQNQLDVADATQSRQAPVRAYVIAGEVTSAQEADARLTQRRVVGRN
jgi:hypothetical protein